MEKKLVIMNRMQEHYDRLVEDGFEIVGLFLQGSQNYNLDYAGSDIDTKAIIVPTLDNIVRNEPMISTTLLMENDEHIDTKDVRAMFKAIKKQNINFVEILFTEYCIINPKYADLIQELKNSAERIARLNNYIAINCMTGMAYEKFKALKHPYPATLDKIERFGYDPKQLHHILRMEEFMRRYIAGEPYKDCLIAENRGYLLSVKTGALTVQAADIEAKKAIESINNMKVEYGKTHSHVIDEEALNLVDEIGVKIIKRYLREEILR